MLYMFLILCYLYIAYSLRQCPILNYIISFKNQIVDAHVAVWTRVAVKWGCRGYTRDARV